MSIEERLAAIKENIAATAKKAGRSPGEIILLGATKMVEPDRIQEAVNVGLTHIGENRVQEFTEKYGKVEPVHWHFIGHLQTNKVKYIIDKAELIHAVDSARLLDEIQRQAEKHSILANVLIEVNASGEASKFGVSFDAVLPLIEENESRPNVKIAGLMTIGPHTRDETSVRTAFSKMRRLYDSLSGQVFSHAGMQYLSMGMSGDYSIAIEEGANIVRVGSAIFGHRENGGKE